MPWIGYVLVIASAVAFGFIPTFYHFATVGGAGFAAVLFFRFAGASLVLFGVARARGLSLPGGKLLLALVLLGALGYFGESTCYFLALEHAPSGVVALLLYVNPAVVTLLSRVVFGERLTARRMTALVLALTGAALTAWAPGGRAVETAGVMLGLGSAVAYGAYLVASARVAQRVHPIVSAAIVTGAAGGAFGVLALVKGGSAPVGATAWAGVLGLSLVSTVFSITALFAGIARVGAVRAATVSVIEPAVAAGLGAMLLGEALTPLRIIGGVLILIAAVVVARGGSDAQLPPPSADAPAAEVPGI
jgi:drug/metabolite transporter (DMT)-like permease